MKIFFLFVLLTLVYFYLYWGFHDMFLTITQDYISNYVGARYVISHPSFAFIINFPHFIPLSFFYSFIIQSITKDIHWLEVLITLIIHVINACMIFRITGIMCKNRFLPGFVSSFLFLTSMIHLDNLLSFPHSQIVAASSLGILSLYYFFKIMEVGADYKRRFLYYSFLLYFISITVYDGFIGLIMFYFLVMLIRIRYFRKDLLCLLGIVSLFFIIRSILQKYYLSIYNVNIVPPSISFDLVNNIKNYNYSFINLTSLLFHNFAKTLASLLNDNISYYYNRNLVLFLLLAPLVFFKMKKILRIYSLLILIYLLFIPYLFSRVPLCDRHITSTTVATSLFIGLLFYYTYEAIYKLKKVRLRQILHLILIFLVGIFFFKYLTIAKAEVEKYINFHSSFSPYLKRFTSDFKKIKVYNPKKQIYFLKGEIPKEANFIGNPEALCYNIFYHAIKYKRLPIDLYLYVYKELESGVDYVITPDNYFINLPDGSCFGFFKDKEKLLGLISRDHDISSEDVIVLDWQDGLKQVNFE